MQVAVRVNPVAKSRKKSEANPRKYGRMVRLSDELVTYMEEVSRREGSASLAATMDRHFLAIAKKMCRDAVNKFKEQLDD